jgi:hypothetical protein
VVAGLTLAQLIALAMMLVGGVWLLVLRSRTRGAGPVAARAAS